MNNNVQINNEQPSKFLTVLGKIWFYIKKVFEDKKFKRECPPISFHRDYNGYSDAYGAQYIISKYDEKTNAYAQAIKEAIEDCEKDLLEIQENSLVGGM